MPTPANNRVESLIPRPTAFKPGVSGNPRGRRPGTQNKRTTEARELCTGLLAHPDYLPSLQKRLIAGTAGAMEPLVWAYAFGRPVDRVETGSPGEFAQMSNDELKRRLRAALTATPQE